MMVTGKTLLMMGSNLGRESEGLEIGRNLKFHGGFGEETMVEELLRSESRRSNAVAKDRGDDVEGQQLSGLQNTIRLNEAIDGLGGKFECFNEVIDELEEEPRQFNVAIKEASGQMQTLTEIKSLYVDIGLVSVIGSNSKF